MNKFEIVFVLLITTHVRGEFLSDLYTLANEVVEGYFKGFKCITYITDNVDNWKYLEQTHQWFLVKINNFEDFSAGYLLTQSYEQGCGGYVIHIKNENRLELIKQLKDSKEVAVRYRYNKQRYLILPTEVNDTDMKYLQHKVLFFFPNLVVVVPRDNETFSLMTHTTFDEYKKKVLGEHEEFVDTWSASSGYRTGVNLYRNKIANVRGKNLRFGLIHYVPYTLILTHGNKTVYDGLEPRIAAVFVDLINGTWDAVDNPVYLWGDFLENGTANGILGTVQKHAADFGFAAIYQWNCENLDCSYSYVQAGVTCLVPRPQLVSGWYTILIPFGLSTWIALTIAYLLISFFVLILTRGQNTIRGIKNDSVVAMAFEAFFNVFRLQLEQIPKLAQKTTPVSTYIRISTLYYYFVAAFWQGIIASVLMVPQYEEPINTAEDLVKRYPEVKWGANHDSWILQITDAQDPILRVIIDKYVIISDEELEKRPVQRDFGYFMERLPHGHYGFNDYITKDNMKYLRIMEKDVYKANVVTVMPRDCPYTEYYDHVVSWMFDTGIIHKIEDQVSLEVIDNKLQLMIKTSNDKERYEGIVLALRHLEGPLYIYFFGIFVSTLAFLLEVFYLDKKNKKKKKTFRSRVKALEAYNAMLQILSEKA